MTRQEKESQYHQTSLGELGEEPELTHITLETCETFTCAVYSTIKGAGRKVNDGRNWLFCQKGNIIEQKSPRPTPGSS